MYVRCENPTRETGELQNAPGPYNFPLCTLVHCANIATPTFYQYKTSKTKFVLPSLDLLKLPNKLERTKSTKEDVIDNNFLEKILFIYW